MNEITKQSKEDIAKQIEELGLDLKLANINEDGSVDYDNDVFIFKKNLTEIPINFGTINGSFYCSDNKLTSLKNAPHTVLGDFYCNGNKLKSLKYGPLTVSRDYNCGRNELECLEGAPKTIKAEFCCSHNKLTSLEYCPEIVDGNFWCEHNNLINLEHCPKVVEGEFLAGFNNINTLKYFPEIIGGNAILCNNELQDIDDLPRCKISEELEIGWKNQSPEKNKQENLEMKVYTNSDLEQKFKTNEITALKDVLSNQLNNTKISTKRKLKL